MAKNKKDVFKEGVDSYSVNLLWLNRKKDEILKYIHPAKNSEGIINNEQSLIDKLLNPVLKWAKENKKEDNAEIKIWYDSILHTPEQIENTKQVLFKLAEKQESSNITLNDINKIDFVKNNKFLFTEDMPLYFCVDFFKLIILAHELITQKKDGTAFSDTIRQNEYGKTPDKYLDKNELFGLANSEIMNMLENFGVVTNKGRVAAENQFIQMVNDEKAVDALRHIINACAMRAVEVLNAPQHLQKSLMSYMYTIPFVSTIKELSKFYMGLKADTIEINKGFFENQISNNQWETYNHKEHGYKSLGNFIIQCSYVYADIRTDSQEITSLDQVIRFGYTNNDCNGSRKVSFFEGGNAHTDSNVILPEEGHAPFITQYWQDDCEVGIIG